MYIFNHFIGDAVPCLEYTCNNGECISMLYVCNKEEDCTDGSDEHGRCGKYSVKYS
jgi:Low-density lipoprotein receptor domain class A.